MSDDGPHYSVVVADKVSSTGLEVLTQDDRFDVHLAAGWDEAALNGVLATADALIVRSATKVTREVLERAPRLRVVGRAGVGVDNIDLEAATERGIPVLNAPAGNTVSAAELAMALLLALVRNVSAADRSVRSGAWERTVFAGTELRGKTLGLVGAGRIGGEVAVRARAFEMRVIVFDPYLSSERADRLGVRRVPELGELLETADIVSLHVPLTPTTEGMIGDAELRRMKPTAYLVNAARGGVVDEEALAKALGEGRLAGAALDVYASEPLPEGSPLRDAPHVILTPHLGASTAEAQELVAVEIAEAVRGALLEGDLSRAVNAPAVGGEVLQRLRPLLDLGTRMGRLACSMSANGILTVEIRYHGRAPDAVKPLSAAVLAGVLEAVVGREHVNFVNAIHRAESRGIRLTTSSVSRHPDYSEYVEIEIGTGRGPVRIAGALLDGTHPRILRINDFLIDMAPHGTLVVLRNQDVPGVIGQVGTMVASLGLNIAGYYQSRLAPGGDAMAALNIDGEVTQELVAGLRGLPKIADVRVARLD